MADFEPVGPEVYRGPADPSHVTPAHIAKINTALREPWVTSTKWIDAKGLPVAAIVAMYRAKGWEVSSSSDQRDGTALVFHAPKGRS